MMIDNNNVKKLTINIEWRIEIKRIFILDFTSARNKLFQYTFLMRHTILKYMSKDLHAKGIF